jgi:N-acetylglucosamine-6-phosphate deacetylase
MLIAADLVWTGDRFERGLGVETAGGHLRALRPLAPGEIPDRHAALIGPALSDLQVNGSGGVMLNSDPTPEAIAHIVATQRTRGTGWVMPTLITCEPERMRRAGKAAARAWGLPGFLGLHLEGPHLNPDRRGTHSAGPMGPLSETTRAVVRDLRAQGIPVMVTLAPEIAGPEAVRDLAAMGAVVSGGHSAATAEQTRAALAAGMRCFTHLYNAMPPMTSRGPGILGAAINSDAHAGIIADGHHVSWEMVALALRARPLPDRMFLVSDAMATIGGPDQFELYGEIIRLRDGALVNAAGALAGAHVDLVTSLRNMVTHVGVPLSEAYAMAALVPRDVMGLPRPGLREGQPLAEVLALDAALERLPLE